MEIISVIFFVSYMIFNLAVIVYYVDETISVRSFFLEELKGLYKNKNLFGKIYVSVFILIIVPSIVAFGVIQLLIFLYRLGEKK